MFGDGSSAYLSLKLGEKNKKEASKGVLNGILISVIVAVLLLCNYYRLFATNFKFIWMY